MNEQEYAAWELDVFLTRLGVPYAIIGGLAVRQWGEPRFTQDVDVTAMLPLEDPVPILREIAGHFSPRLPDAVNFARCTRWTGNWSRVRSCVSAPPRTSSSTRQWPDGPRICVTLRALFTARDQRWTLPPSAAGWERSSRCWRSRTCSNASRRRGER